VTETERSLPGLAKEISALPSVSNVRYKEGASGFIADSFHFTPTWGGAAAVIMRRDALGYVFARVNEILGWGSAAGVMIYAMGEAAGRAGYQNFKATMGEALIEREYLQIVDVYRAVGWGIISFRGLLRDQKSIEAVIADNFECLHYKGQAASPRSQFVRGALAGWFSEMYHPRINCTENRCIAKGDQYCEFTIEKTTQ
jgi:predicted hydrocarbon binding protein